MTGFDESEFNEDALPDQPPRSSPEDLEGGIFSLVVSLYTERSAVLGEDAARANVADYLEKLATAMRLLKGETSE